jgi:hypothetical protein
VLEDIATRAKAIVMAWFPGPQGNRAIAALLSGQAEPSGRLTVSLPRSTGAMPFAYNHKPLARGVPSQPAFDPAFAFGHGLSYTQFSWEAFAAPAAQMDTAGQMTLDITVRNTGSRPGTELVQLYVRDPIASVTRPVLELKGFARIDLQPGQAQRLRFCLHADALAFTGPDGHSLIVEPGALHIALGSSSAALKFHAPCELTGPARRLARRQAFGAVATLSPAD